MYRVYVIQNPQGRFYIGLSENIEARLRRHNRGESKWTKGKGPWIVKWTSDKMPITEARKLENLLKRQKGGEGFYRITGIERPPAS